MDENSQIDVGDEVEIGPFWGPQADTVLNTSVPGTVPVANELRNPENYSDLLIDFEGTASQEIVSFDGVELDFFSDFGDVDIYSQDPAQVQNTTSNYESTFLEQQTSSLNDIDPSDSSSEFSDEDGAWVKSGQNCGQQSMDRNDEPTQPLTAAAAKSVKTKSLIMNQNDRKNRFMSGVQTIFAKIKRIEVRTGARAEVKATYEFREYTLEDGDEFLTFRKGFLRSSIESLETSKPTSEELEDDHRYAATVLTQKLSSTSVHDHQYNEVSTSSGSKRIKKAWYQVHGSPRSHHDRKRFQKSNELFIKKKYERERTLRQFLATIFSKIITLEVLTGSRIELIVLYETHQFTSQNYTEAESMLRKTRTPRHKVSHVNATVTRIPSTLSPGLQSKMLIRFQPTVNSAALPPVYVEPESDSLSLPPEIDNQESYSNSVSVDDSLTELVAASPSAPNSTTTETTKIGASTSTEVICSKCSEHFPPHYNQGRQICWIRCADPLCQYLVHSACIGFYALYPKELRRLPPFYCELHRNWEDI